jgi:hypothetical protein
VKYFRIVSEPHTSVFWSPVGNTETWVPLTLGGQRGCCWAHHSLFPCLHTRKSHGVNSSSKAAGTGRGATHGPVQQSALSWKKQSRRLLGLVWWHEGGPGERQNVVVTSSVMCVVKKLAALGLGCGSQQSTCLTSVKPQVPGTARKKIAILDFK